MFQVDAGSSWLRLTAIRIPDGTDTYEGISAKILAKS